MVWFNALYLALALIGTAGLVAWASHRSLMATVDQDLSARAQDLARMEGPGPGPGRGGMGRGRPEGPRRPLGPDLRPILLDRDGSNIMRGDERGPIDRDLFLAALRGEETLETRVVDGVPTRIVSVPRLDRDEIVGAVQISRELGSFDLARRAQFGAIALAIPLVVLGSILLARRFSGLVLRPLSRLTAAAERIAAAPERSEVISIEDRDEIGRLSEALNRMTKSLQGANQALADSLDRQRRFTSDAAHELRTPLTSIGLAAENGLHPSATHDEQVASLQTIDRQARQMTRLTELLLTLARLDHAQEPLPLQATGVCAMVEEVAASLGLSSDPRWRNEVAPGFSAMANPDALRQILRNLIENAAAHTPGDGRILARWRNDRLEIADSGPGIAPEHLAHLFDRFYRVDASRTRQSGGFGLGLAIARSLAQASLATLGVESEQGSGTIFWISFPEGADLITSS